jgi:hypothetical protein
MTQTSSTAQTSNGQYLQRILDQPPVSLSNASGLEDDGDVAYHSRIAALTGRVRSVLCHEYRAVAEYPFDELTEDGFFAGSIEESMASSQCHAPKSGQAALLAFNAVGFLTRMLTCPWILLELRGDDFDYIERRISNLEGRLINYG